MDRRTIRSGLLVTLGLGFGLAGASGYPNNSTEIGNPDFYSSSDLLTGSGTTLYVAGALADYVNFGFVIASQSFRSKDWTERGTGIGFRAEVFPLITLVPALKGVAAFAQFGIGSAKLDARVGNYPEALGTQSFIGVGALWEFTIFHLLGGHGVVGPTLEYDAIYASSISSGAALLGVRVGFYGGM